MNDLHLAISMRSFRAEALSDFVGHVIDKRTRIRENGTPASIHADYPIYLTRSLKTAKDWLRAKARGTERYGLVASSGAQRLKPEGIHVKAEIEPPVWFLNPGSDVRSSYYLEDVATEFAVQGLELDWGGRMLGRQLPPRQHKMGVSRLQRHQMAVDKGRIKKALSEECLSCHSHASSPGNGDLHSIWQLAGSHASAAFL